MTNPMMQPNYQAMPDEPVEPRCSLCEEDLRFRKLGGAVRVSCDCGHSNDLVCSYDFNWKKFSHLIK